MAEEQAVPDDIMRDLREVFGDMGPTPVQANYGPSVNTRDDGTSPVGVAVSLSEVLRQRRQRRELELERQTRNYPRDIEAQIKALEAAAVESNTAEIRKQMLSTAWKFEADNLRLKEDDVTEKDLAYYTKVYTDYINPKIEEIKQIAEAYFPNMWDFQITQGRVNIADSIGLYLMRRELESVQRISREHRDNIKGSFGDEQFRLVIRFPEITITNSFELKHTIKELYIVIGLAFDLKLVGGLRGFRMKKTLREFKHKYNHSHLRCSEYGENGFCLGTTELETLVSTMSVYEFDTINFELLLQTLPQYLSWESLEGGPHLRISTLSKPYSTNTEAASISFSDVTAVINGIASSKDTFKYGLTHTSDSIVVSIRDDLEFRKMLTKHCNIRYKLPYDENTLISLFERPSEETLVVVDMLNKSINQQIRFKGETIKFSIEPLLEEQKEKKAKENLLIDSRLVPRVIERLQADLRDHIIKGFEYGVQTTGERS